MENDEKQTKQAARPVKGVKSNMQLFVCNVFGFYVLVSINMFKMSVSTLAVARKMHKYIHVSMSHVCNIFVS